jgi:hypothetical protein
MTTTTKAKLGGNAETVKAKTWQNLYFLRDGRSGLGVEIHPTIDDCVHEAEHDFKICRQHPFMSFGFKSDPSIIFLGRDISHFIPVPAKP